MEYENMAANTVVDTAPEATAAPESQTVGSAAAPSDQSAGQDVTRTQAFSRRLNEMSARNTDAEIKKLGMFNPYNNSPIESLEQLRQYRAMQDADERGLDPQSTAELNSLRSQLAGYQLREQEAAIKADPNLSGIYDEYRDEVMAFAEYAAAEGRPIDLDAALRVVMSQNYDAIRARDAERARNEALAGINANRAASPGAVGGSPAGNSAGYADMSDADFERVLAAAKRGELRKS